MESDVQSESAYLSASISLLSSIFSHDDTGDCLILRLPEASESPNPLLQKLLAFQLTGKLPTTSSSISSSLMSPPAAPKPPSRPFVDLSNLISPYLAPPPSPSSPQYYTFALSTIDGHSYSAVPFQSCVKAVAIHLCHAPFRGQDAPHPILFVPAYVQPLTPTPNHNHASLKR